MVAFIAVVLLRTGPARDAGIQVLPTMALLSVVVGGTGVLLLIFGNAPPPPATIHAYEAGLVAVGFALLFNVFDHRARLGRIDRRGRRAHARSGRLRARTPGECACATRASRWPSPSTTAARTVWVDELGRRIEPLRATGSRAVVPILVDGRAVAQFACESVVIDEPGLMPSIEAAARLAANNAQLRASLRAEAAALQASRLRLLSAADDERIALADQLDRGAGASLAELRGDDRSDPGRRPIRRSTRPSSRAAVGSRVSMPDSGPCRPASDPRR